MTEPEPRYYVKKISKPHYITDAINSALDFDSIHGPPEYRQRMIEFRRQLVEHLKIELAESLEYERKQQEEKKE